MVSYFRFLKVLSPSLGATAVCSVKFLLIKAPWIVIAFIYRDQLCFLYATLIMGSLGDFWITSSNWSYSASGMLHCSAQSDALQSTIGALGAVAHTCLFLTCFAHRESMVAILVIFYRVQNTMIFFLIQKGVGTQPLQWSSNTSVFLLFFLYFFSFFFLKICLQYPVHYHFFPAKYKPADFSNLKMACSKSADLATSSRRGGPPLGS